MRKWFWQRKYHITTVIVLVAYASLDLQIASGYILGVIFGMGLVEEMRDLVYRRRDSQS